MFSFFEGRRFAELEIKLLLAQVYITNTQFSECNVALVVMQIVLNFKMSTDKSEIKWAQKAVVIPVEDVPIKFVDRH